MGPAEHTKLLPSIRASCELENARTRMNCPTVALLAYGLLASSAAGKELRAFHAFDIGFPKTGTQAVTRIFKDLGYVRT